MSSSALRVAVIGAGAAGLVACKYVLELGMTPVVFEKAPAIGGTWIYTEQPDTWIEQVLQKQGSGRSDILLGLQATLSGQVGAHVHSSMYDSLTTNLPTDVMEFSDFQFHSELGEFPPHPEVLKYLQDYAQHFKLYPHIRFNTAVTHVQLLHHDATHPRNNRWSITYSSYDSSSDSSSSSSSSSSTTSTIEVNAVMVCTGHYFIPYIPPIPGDQHFTGFRFHTHNYRRPDDRFHHKTVVVIGKGPSGVDVVREIAPVAKQVYWSGSGFQRESAATIVQTVETLRQLLQEQYRPEVDRLIEEFKRTGPKHELRTLHRVGPPTSISKQGVVSFEGGSTCQPDVIIYATGYEFAFPFLSSDQVNVSCEGQRVSPLYKQLWHIDTPTLCFVGLPKQIVPFPLCEHQVAAFVHYLKGTFQLPGEAEMIKSMEQEFDMEDERHSHYLGLRQFEYCSELAKLFSAEPSSMEFGGTKCQRYIQTSLIRTLGKAHL